MDASPTDPETGLPERLAQIQAFLIECDRFKHVLRRNHTVDGGRWENDAEHTWHMALYAVLLAPEVGLEVDLGRVLSMIVVHDLVEIDAGDTFAYDAAAQADQAEREKAAADRIFGLLPADRARQIRDLWEEFEAGATAEARFARALDRLQAFAQNVASGGKAHREHGVTRAQTRGRMAEALAADPVLAAMVEALYARADGTPGYWTSASGDR
jgi:putative hydrolase of HD superfamily